MHSIHLRTHLLNAVGFKETLFQFISYSLTCNTFTFVVFFGLIDFGHLSTRLFLINRFLNIKIESKMNDEQNSVHNAKSALIGSNPNK